MPRSVLVGVCLLILLLVTGLVFWVGWVGSRPVTLEPSSSKAAIRSAVPSSRSPVPLLTSTLPSGVTLEMVSSDPQVVLLHNFLSPDECQHLIQLGETTGFTRSTVQGGRDPQTVTTHRTSHSVSLQRQQDDIIHAIERRAASLCNYPLAHVENLQVVRYQPGQQYQHHYDFFVPGTSGTTEALKRGGQRAITLFVYLNDLSPDDAGGHTDFPRLGLQVRPRRGTAVLWYDLLQNQEDFRTYHAGLPPQISTKYGLNIWIREAPFQ